MTTPNDPKPPVGRANDAPRNRLGESTSPYLRQHADNPVAWLEWGEEALSRARREDKPILLSVGYSACHWCHVMAHESFEDPDVAAVMNELFINIKVDREERPDIDAIYQQVVQLMGQGGGWPLTVWLTPEQQPYYGGTYFPPTSKYGRPGFVEVCRALADLYANKKEDVRRQVGAFEEGFAALAKIVEEEAEHATGDPQPDDPHAMRVAARRLLSKFDEDWGGFGREPKFPNPTGLEIFAALGRAGELVGAPDVVRDCRHAVKLTLDRMYRGGIYDHLRGGFARYSVDRVWLVPHFKKMLYDNAQLLPLYAEAAARDGLDFGWTVAHEGVEYLAADMRSDNGTFYSATDADSEGEEGKYFVWTPEEIHEVLGDEAQAELLCEVYGVEPGGNFEGASILNLPKPIEPGVWTELAPAREKLLAHRYGRVPPLRDDKILTSWNALLVTGLLRTSWAAAQTKPELAARSGELAEAALKRLLDAHVLEDGTVLRSDFEGRVHLRGYLEDVAYLGRACLDHHEHTLQPASLEQARSLAVYAMQHHLTADRDGFHLTADDADALILRTEAQHDGPIPSGLGVMVELLARLGLAEVAPDGTEEVLRRILARFRGATVQPFGYASLLTGARHLGPQAVHVTLRGPSEHDETLQRWARRVRDERVRRGPATTLSFVADDTAMAIVCRDGVCTAPLRTGDDLSNALESPIAAG